MLKTLRKGERRKVKMAKEELVSQPIFKKSVGKSERSWNNISAGTSRGVVCQLCGKEWPDISEGKETYTLGSFLGLQFVEECCGRSVDVLYKEFGETFAMAFLNDFARDPTSRRFSFLVFCLPEVLEKAQQNTGKIVDQMSILQGQLL
jgi:hypothetical protein